LTVLEKKHRLLGPIVRVGPADLSVSCYENGVRTIYNGGFEKPEYYNFFSYYGKKNAFCSLTRQDHTLRRKRMSAAYTKSALFTSEPLSSLTQTILIERLLPMLQHQACLNEPTDILSLSYSLSLDLLTCFQFGLSSGSNFLQSPMTITPWIRHYEQRYCKESFWPQELPTITCLLKALGIDMLPKSQHDSTQFLESWLLEMCDKAEVACLAAEKQGLMRAGDTPVVYQQVKKAVELDMPDATLDKKKREIASELFDHMCM
jgi:unspecific monooxygenase